MFTRTTAINKIASLKKTVKAVRGGTSAGKTYGILPILINKATKRPLLEISVVSESVPHLKRGAIKDFKKIMQETGRWNASRWNATDSRYTFSNKSFIEFFSADQDDKLRGARRDMLYVNEANNISFSAYNELAMRTHEDIYLDWNPVSTFWFDNEIKNDDNVDFITLTYEDNEAAPKSAIDFILRAKEKASTSSYWQNWYKVYGLGEVGSLEGVVFSNWKQIDHIPEEARLLGLGLDFGYTNDPTAIVEIYQYNEHRILNEICYQTGLLNSQIADKLPKGHYIIADSAEPKSIAELRRHGRNVIGVTKGRDSINYGIDIMQRQNYLVTASSTNLIKELRNYAWDADKKTGAKMNKPIDSYNHAIDAIRYHEMETLGISPPKKTFRKTY